MKKMFDEQDLDIENKLLQSESGNDQWKDSLKSCLSSFLLLFVCMIIIGSICCWVMIDWKRQIKRDNEQLEIEKKNLILNFEEEKRRLELALEKEKEKSEKNRLRWEREKAQMREYGHYTSSYYYYPRYTRTPRGVRVRYRDGSGRKRRH